VGRAPVHRGHPGRCHRRADRHLGGEDLLRGTVYNTPGTPAYFELITREYARAVEFYRDVFGWDPHVVSDTAEFRLAALREG